MMDGIIVVIIIASCIGVVFVIAFCKKNFCKNEETSNAKHSRSAGFVGRRKDSRDNYNSCIGIGDNMYGTPFSNSIDINDCDDTTDWEYTTDWDSHHHSSSRNDCSDAHESHSHHDTGTSDHCRDVNDCSDAHESHSHHDTGTSDHCTSTWDSPSTCDTSYSATCDTSTYE